MCSVSCGGGVQERTRTCSEPECGGADCVGEDNEQQSCNTQCCPVNGMWSHWTDFEACSVSCGGGVQQRTRTCSNPAPECGGTDCIGAATEQQSCNTQGCPVNGEWSEFGPFGSCSVNCDGGFRSRSRTCDSPPPANGGMDCPCGDPMVQYEGCNCIDCVTGDAMAPCPINGVWSSWSEFSPCSVTCGGGTRSRKRECNNPPAVDTGTDCPGDSCEVAICNTQPCPQM